jgi:IS5 family transposase
MGVKEKPDIIDIIERKRLQWYGHVKRMLEERLSKLIMKWIPGGGGPGEKRTSKKNVDGRCTSHEKESFRSRSVVKQKEMVFRFRKTATAVTRPERQMAYEDGTDRVFRNVSV